jgi:endo-1,4-beta-xylanase
VQKILFALAFAGWLVTSAAALAVPTGTSVLPNDLSAFTLQGVQAGLGKIDIVPVEGQSFTSALHIATEPGSTAEWNLQACADTTANVKSGDVLLAHFWLRCLDSMTGEGYTAFEFEATEGDFEKAMDFRISAGSQWTEISIPFRTHRDFLVGHTHVALREGFDRQTVEIGGLTVMNLGPKVDLKSLPRTRVSYTGRSPDASWRKDALDRIEKIRKGDFTVLVTDANGSPTSGVQIHATLARHLFGFGTCVDTDAILGTSPDDRKYQQTILSMFNRAVFENDMKWQATWNGVPPRVDQALAWLRSHDIAVRGHNLVWPSWRWLPRGLRAYRNDPVKLDAITDKHITDVVSHFRGELTDWDVVNEVYANHDLVDLLGGRQIMVKWFNLAHAADPAARLCINDYGILDGGTFNSHRDSFYNTIKFLQDQGAPLGGIGIQSHFGTELPAPTQILSILDHFAKFGLPIESTEISFDTGDPQLTADYLRDYTIAVFSHPDVTDMLLWGFWAKRHWRPGAALFNDDWSIRPNGQAWLDLQKQWKTDVDLTADKSGLAHFRGFFGDYNLTITTGGRTQTISAPLVKNGAQFTMRLE